jgi:hypothetical protein
MNHKQVIEHWINQDKTKAHGFNVYFEGKTIYSYGSHFPMATILDNGIILVNSDSYSVSTSKHQSYVRYAIGDRPTIEVPTNLLSNMASELNFHGGVKMESKNLAAQALLKRYDNAVLKAKRARSETMREVWNREINSLNGMVANLSNLPMQKDKPISQYPL